MSTQPIPRLTIDEYLEIERAGETRSEYLQGHMYAMSGASRQHARIVNSLVGILYRQLRGSDCKAVSNDLRLAVTKHALVTYPDVFVTCGPDQFLDKRTDTLVDATVIIEVLSPSTKDYDRGEKFLFYRALPSFQEYLLLAQSEIRAEHHVRQPDGSWLMREYCSSTDQIELRSIGCSLSLAEVYERVELPQTQP